MDKRESELQNIKVCTFFPVGLIDIFLFQQREEAEWIRMVEIERASGRSSLVSSIDPLSDSIVDDGDSNRHFFFGTSFLVR